MKSKQPQVVIVGRTNVGKSTLFNRLAPNVRSITLDYQGVTRDFLHDTVDWQGRTFSLVDSGGISLKKTKDALFEKMRSMVINLIEQSDVVLFMVDGKAGLLPEDRDIARMLHKLGKPVVVVINKTDTKIAREQSYEFEQLGFGQTVSISAQHGIGIDELLEAVLHDLPQKGSGAEIEKPSYKVALLGKPNVGKSSLLNILLDKERALVSELAGTTREAITESISFYQEAIQVTDTPGVRRKRSVTGELEPLMVQSTLRAVDNANIVVLLIDAAETQLSHQELKLMSYAFEDQKKALIILFNKDDLMDEVTKADLEHSLSEYTFLLKKVPQLTISCKTGKNVGKVLPLIQQVWERYSQQFIPEELNELLKQALIRKPLYHKTNPLMLFKAEQVKAAPITIVLKVNVPDWFGQSQLGYFENVLRAEYDLVGVPIKFIVRKRR